MNHQEPSRLRALLSWLPVPLAGLVIGLFGARVLFEVWPARLAVLATSQGTTGVALASGLLSVLLHWLGSRLADAESKANAVTLLPFSLLLVYVFWPQVNLLVAGLVFAAAIGLSLALTVRHFIQSEHFWRWAIPIMLATVVLIAYLRTVGQTVGEADTFELQVVAPTLGIAHPTGYSLFILLGKLFSLIPLGQVAWRVNLVSVTFGIVASVLLYFALCKLTGQRATSALAALCLAFSRVFWSQGVEAEVYLLNATFVTAILWLLVVGQDEILSGRRWLFAIAALYGLSFTNHLTMAILGPAVVLGILFARRQVRRIDWLLAAGCFLAPLLILLYFPLRWPALHNGQWMQFKEFIDLITGQQFRGAMQFGLWRDPTRWNIMSSMLLDVFNPVGVALAAFGLAWLTARKWHIALLTFIAFAGYWFYGLVYNVPDISVFVIPVHILMALWIGTAVAGLIHWLSRLAQRSWSTRLAQVAFALLPLSLAWTNGPLVDQSQTGWDLYDWGKSVMELPMPTGSAILADSEKIAPLYYLKRIENIRPDVETIVLGDEALYRARLDQLVAEGKPTYLARYLPGIAGPYRLHSLGPLARVTTKPVTLLPLVDKQLINVTWGNGQVALLGIDVRPGQGTVAWRITLYWQARTKLDANYHVRLRWIGPSGQVWWQDHGAHPVGGYNPTVAWQPGEVIADYHEIPADATIPPVLLQLDVGLFLPFRDEGLNRDGTDSPWYTLVLLDSVPVTSRPRLAHVMRASFTEMLITGASDPGVLPPGEPVSIVFAWSRLKPGPDRTLQLRWADAQGKEVQVMQVTPYSGEYPTSQWPAGQSLLSRVTVSAPTSSGTYTLHAGWLDEDGKALPAQCAWLAPLSQDCVVGTLHVEGEARAQGINFDNQALLLDAHIEQTQVRPNETVQINLKWQGLRQWNADYTAFVHLIGPDGKLHGQVDQWPLDGTLATRDWQPGRVIDDPYRVTLAGDAPAGTYQVEVGWYLLATLRRLPVVDAEGRPMDDRVIIGTVTVNGQ